MAQGRSELKAIPVVAVTAFAMKGDEERIREGGCEAYLSKPISVGKFIETIRHFLGPPEEPVDDRPRPRRRRCAANVKLLEARLSAEYFDVVTAMSGRWRRWRSASAPSATSCCST